MGHRPSACRSLAQRLLYNGGGAFLQTVTPVLCLAAATQRERSDRRFRPRRSGVRGATANAERLHASWLPFGFEDEVERGLGGSAEAGEAGFGEHVAKAGFAGLGAERRGRLWESEFGVQMNVEAA